MWVTLTVFLSVIPSALAAPSRLFAQGGPAEVGDALGKHLDPAKGLGCGAYCHPPSDCKGHVLLKAEAARGVSGCSVLGFSRGLWKPPLNFATS